MIFFFSMIKDETTTVSINCLCFNFLVSFRFAIIIYR